MMSVVLRGILFAVLLILTSVNGWARGGGGCFLPSTRILMADLSSRPISTIQPGDQVEAYQADGKLVSTTVRAVLKHHVKSYYKIKAGAVVLNATGNHPIYVGNDVFQPVKQLHSGSVVYAYQNHKLVTYRILHLNKVLETVTVYNLVTDAPHTYFAAGIVVHNKGGGGGGGGSGHGGFGGRGGSCRPGDKFCNFINILFFIVAIVFSLASRVMEKSKNLDYLNSRSTIERKSLKTMKLLNFLAKQDASLSPSVLIDRTKSVFLQLQQCWMNRDYDPMKNLMMPDLYLQHCRQIQGMIRNHEINKLTSLNIQAIDLVNVRYTEKESQREFTALITATLADYYVDDRTGSVLRGNTSPEPFQEFWTFELEPDGWRLRDIEQAGESDYLKEENFVEMFTDLQIKKIYGDEIDNLGASGPWLPKAVAQKESKVDRMLNFLARNNQVWDRQRMLVRVRSVFTQVHLALEAGKLDAETLNVMYPTVATQFKDRLESWRVGGNTIEYRNFCIRKVEIVLVNSFDESAKNEFTARITAHAQTIHLRNGQIVTKDADVTPFVEFWVFGLLGGEWKLKDAKPQAGNEIISAENTEEGSSPNLIKWYYSQKRAL